MTAEDLTNCWIVGGHCREAARYRACASRTAATWGQPGRRNDVAEGEVRLVSSILFRVVPLVGPSSGICAGNRESEPASGDRRAAADRRGGDTSTWLTRQRAISVFGWTRLDGTRDPDDRART